MNPVLVLFATREGHTRLVAEHVSSILRTKGLSTQVICAKDAPGEFDVTSSSAAILAASVHVGKFEPEFVELVSKHRAALEKLPTAFISVSMAEATAEDVHASNERRLGAEENVKQTIERFCQQTGWRPERIKAIAGALLYTQYGVVTRLVMKLIAKSTGAPTDTSRDHDLTDWNALARFVEEFADELPGASEEC
jgi:menaquinone-dependent protoporphyrinogen oxidase